MNKDKVHTLIKDYILNKISKQELIQFLEGFSEEEIQEEYEIVVRTHFDEILEQDYASLDKAYLKEKAREITQSQPFFSQRRLSYMYKLAASVAIVLGLFWAGQKWFKKEGDNVNLAANYKSDYVPKGEKKDLTLMDGTLVKLNSDSRLSYPDEFDRKGRNVKLTGEAFFDVKRDESRPFTINTAAFDIQVLGTSFNVEVHDEDQLATVSVESGTVRVEPLNSKDAYELTKNKKLVLDLKTGAVSLENIDATLDLKWTKGILFFDKTPLAEVKKNLERWYDVEINIEDNSLNNKKLSGQHSNETLEEVLETLAYLLEFKYEINGDKVTIKK